MEKLMTYDEIEKVYGLQPEKIGLWLSKGYIQGADGYVSVSSLKSFMNDIGMDNAGMKVKGSLTTAYRQFVRTWLDILGTELSDMLRECAEDDDMATVAARHDISLSTLQYYIRTASIRLKMYYADVPALRLRLAETIRENRNLQLLLKRQGSNADNSKDVIKEMVCSALKDNMICSERDQETAYRDFMRMLLTSVTELGLSVRCTNAAIKSGVNTLYDFIVVNKACGKSGMLTKLPHFGMRSYQEIEDLLTRLNLIKVDNNGCWTSVADFLIDTNSELFIRYSGSSVQSTHKPRLRGNEMVAEWIGNYMEFTHAKRR
ncbi:DNA-directed RNA polymerase subunit alpha C-terminal domain-containing protein [Parabacteroides merdae]|jgi:hypothetical protein|uniref:DNA-directed RNA polymerase subunit alpha C-terminal domain-containing protein n=1 Tax=Parabacteroides merdae TaxID=46503 RepID=UPI00189E3738|nr:DNA-directed RNA polymerase subunit alpha C-terminal domain-containing protein [Parabacteroides merdae]MBS4865550.1 hypothetical protein [Parabacteroides merdae]MDB8917842.1 DNA-directed RNA polymerase subunit alpha C-terminal domain-containing protein [Parabacteroides merdae]MDB8926261.1 DNA-directed RNA polymerase subunit alpha C-terminal domain-containing protein [Parabacteroides merdae]